jgi:hypothetical protein
LSALKQKLNRIVDALCVERDPKRRVFLSHAHAIQYARRHNGHHATHPELVLGAATDRRIASWLLYHASSDEFRSLADAIDYDVVETWRKNVLTAYFSIVLKYQPEFVAPSTYVPTSPLVWTPMIDTRVAPTIPEVKREFVRLFPTTRLPVNWGWKMRDLIKNTFKLPLRVDKDARKRSSRFRNRKSKRRATKR